MNQQFALKRGGAKKATGRRRPRPAAPRVRLVRLPMASGTLRTYAEKSFAALLATGGLVALWLMQVPQQMWFELATAAARAGFEVRQVEITGLRNMDRLPVYSAALSGPSNSMLLVRLDDVRERLLALPWVADASVARRLPALLHIEIVERVPVAVWQYNRRLAVIDATGRVLDRENVERFANLPLVVGEGANLRATGLLKMLSAHPALARSVRSGTWVSGRRWDLRLRSGELLSLPEGDARARTALAAFARMDREMGLLDRGFVRFDMRLADRMVVRVSGKPGAKAVPLVGSES